MEFVVPDQVHRNSARRRLHPPVRHDYAKFHTGRVKGLGGQGLTRGKAARIMGEALQRIRSQRIVGHA
jgi:hypothetical protein